LVSYSDLITLLFALFVVLYALSQADLKKLRAVREGFNRALSGSSSRTEEASGGDASQSSTRPKVPGVAGADQVAPDTELHEIRRLLEEAMEFDASVEGSGVQTVSGNSTELRWVIYDSYGEGEVEAPLDFWPLLRRVADILARYPDRAIRWEGHAGVEESAEDSRRTWQLSLNRALWMKDFVQKRWRDLDREERNRVDTSAAKTSGRSVLERAPTEVAAFGSTRPLRTKSAKSSTIRWLTRRVELVILPRCRDQTRCGNS